MPKSMTRGPSMVMRMLDGLRSRWIRPGPWMSLSARTSPAARRATDPPGSGPSRVDHLGKRRARDVTGGDPGHLGLGVRVEHGRRPGAAHLRAAVISCEKRRRNSGCRANSLCTTFTATVRPRRDRARYTRPMPPSPSLLSSRKSPIQRGSPALSRSMCCLPLPHRAAARKTARRPPFPAPGLYAGRTPRRGASPICYATERPPRGRCGGVVLVENHTLRSRLETGTRS